MLLRPSFATGLLASLAALTSHAQTAPATTRFYLGAEANLRTNVPFKDYSTVPRIVGPSVTAGLQLTPHLAVQAGLSYHWRTESFGYVYSDPLAGSVTYSGTYAGKYFLVPVLLRYTVTAPTGRWHFDALGGATLIHATGHNTSEYNVAPYREERNDAFTWTNLTLGPGVRYTLSPRFELTASGLVSAAVGDDYYRFSDRLSLNIATGVHYTFGQL